MKPIDHFNLRSFDLNLLIAFDALVSERSVTKAAHRLRIQQPAMSHALATLRILLADEVLVRTGSVMLPTAKAVAMAPRVAEMLMQVQGILTAEDRFDPETEKRIFRFGFSSELEVFLMPGLTAYLQRHAPGIRLLSRGSPRNEVHTLLDTGALDIAVGCFDFGLERHCGMPLYDQSLACCFNPDLIDPDAPLTVERYLALPHALITLKDDIQGCLSEALGRIGQKLNVVLAASDFLTALATAAAAPVLATLPSRIAHQHAAHFGLVLRPVPLDLRIPAVSMVWSARSDRDPAAMWLRAAVASILKNEILISNS
ncbi:LysR family transcriptional regulator [Acetobacter orleanensis]|uniref:LysR family transcriptional regulator n=1 Tax=Acetobacter orleanensis TaxID=104099 RepID=A0A4Y3TQL2_9PROT|nr:LysR family transcriptional regulator [Acetobacter orleanensis]KXV66982.1 LysR family transcriptional regulator [Acetobacter orleanensis]PCD78349.1 LysR family transcriptional regulator [Acetobacter orleanensis]GAN67554.1 transcriptional regulator LysR [Acetobacter orleanensis JCM 7639]GBR28959.1 LysR family transcriptional regulator [Acetobacter orleanensis NRIC 0473]GEB84078.1 LysR family transcriptional regulator [Acetobacter orleanensis]